MAALLAAHSLASLPAPAHADSGLDRYLTAILPFGQHEAAALTLLLGVIVFAVYTAILLLRTRTRATADALAAQERIASLKSDLDRLEAALSSEPQVFVVWGHDDRPDITGAPALLGPKLSVADVLVFESWLDDEAAAELRRCVQSLKARGDGFLLPLATRKGCLIEAEGRAVGGRAVLKLRVVGGVKQELAAMGVAHRRLSAEVNGLRALFETLPAPAWMHDGAGRLAMVNSAYARAVGATDPATALARELIDHEARDGLEQRRDAEGAARMRLPIMTAGSRRVFDIVEIASPASRTGVGIDMSEAEALRAERDRKVEAHRRILNNLATSVAVFGNDGKLIFCNAAYRALWNLDAAFLDAKPSDAAILDRLRGERKLPEQRDFRAWKMDLHEAYRSPDSRPYEWHLPDGRTLRVLTMPNPDGGGVTYLFDDVTERLQLGRKVDALSRVQGETLDNLAESVAVFGSDGRLRLSNPALSRMWRLPADLLEKKPHVEAVIAVCAAMFDDAPTWQALRQAITDLDSREPVGRRMERRDGSVLDCSTIPLPDGGTLVTFQDVTDSVNVERALRERNDALVAADEIKLDFVHHVSYELRTPLTNIIGFAHILGDAAIGPLTPRQDEYLRYITSSTDALLAIINNILDLASIDAGAMTLDLGEVDIRATMKEASVGIQDRLVQSDIVLDIQAAAAIGSFVADRSRVRQVLFNLLSNAVGFSPPGSTVTLAAERTSNAVVFSVTDSGPGIPADMVDKVFDWFETGARGSSHHGTGLGLSIVRSFVMLHKGHVAIQSEVGHGTTVLCTFPLETAAHLSAAE